MKDLLASPYGFYDVLPSDRHRRALPVRYVQALTFSPDGKALATSDCTGKKTQVRVWNVETGDLRARMGCEDSVDMLAYSPDGMTLAATCGKTVKLWRVSELAGLPPADK